MAEGPDRGRAWVVAVAILILYIACSGAFRSQGLFFVSIISTFKVDRKMAALPFSVKGSVRNLLAPLVGVLGQKYGCSTVILMGGIISAASTSLCYFAPDVLWLTGLWGGVSAIGAAMTTVLLPVVLGQYFVKYRTTATGLAFSGSCIGAFVFPAIVEYLLLNYGLHGTFLIYAGVFLHIIPAAMLFTKPKWSTSVAGNAHPEESSSERVAKPDQSSRNGSAAAANQNNLDARPKVTFHVGDEPEPRQYLPSSRALNSVFSLHEPTPCQDGKNGLLKVPTLSSLSLNSRLIKSSTDNFFDIDIDYLKQRGELLFNMLSMDLPNMEMSYRAILLEVDKDDLWHPEKEEIIQEVESIYIQLEKSLDIDIISESTVRANGLYLKRTAMNKALTASKKSQSLRGVRRYFRTYKARALHLGKNRSAPNISNIYNELVRRDYILSKLKMLCNSNEIRIISHLSEHNPRDVLKVLFQLRCLYALYQYLELNEHEVANELGDSSNDGTDMCSHDSPDQPVELSKTVLPDETPRNDNSFLHHLKNAMRLFKNPHFLLICFTRTAHFVAFTPINTTIVDLTMDRGLRATDGKLAILALSAGDLVGRLGFGWVTDKGFATLPRFVLSGQILQCLCCVSISVLQAKWSLFPSIALFGMITGSLYIRHSVLVSMYLREEEQSIAMGCMELCSGCIGFLIPLYIGYFRDVIGSYNQMYYINGALALLAGLSWLLEPYFTKLNNFK